MAWKDFLKRKQVRSEYECWVKIGDDWIKLYGEEPSRDRAVSRLKNYDNDRRRGGSRLAEVQMKVVEVQTVNRRKTIWRNG